MYRMCCDTFCFCQEHPIMPKPSLSFLLCVLFSITIALFHPVHANELSKGLELYQAKKYREAIPLLEKAAKDGHEEAILALDQIYANEKPAVNMTDNQEPTSESVTAKKMTDIDSKKGAQAVPMYEKATVTEDPKEAAENASMRKELLIGIAFFIVLIGIIHYFLLRRIRNQNYRRETPLDRKPKSKR